MNVEMSNILLAVADQRAVTLTEPQLVGYQHALAGCEPMEVWDAHMRLWATQDRLGMPSPASIIEDVRRHRRMQGAKEAAIDTGGDVPEDERRFGIVCFDLMRELWAKRMTLQEVEREMDKAAAAMLTPQALRRYNHAAYEART